MMLDPPQSAKPCGRSCPARPALAGGRRCAPTSRRI